MYCSKCGKEIFDDAIICPGCGCATGNPLPTGNVNNRGDAPSFGYATLCFFFPLIGLILFLVWKNELPLRAKSCGKGALIGFLTSIAVWVLMYALFFVFILLLANAGMEMAFILPFMV